MSSGIRSVATNATTKRTQIKVNIKLIALMVFFFIGFLSFFENLENKFSNPRIGTFKINARIKPKTTG